MMPRSAALLKAVIERGDFTTSDLAQSLACTPHELAAFAEGLPVMPLTCQARLAKLVIARVPVLARRGHALRAQVAAATRFHSHDTTVHSEPPTRWPTRKR